MDVSLAAEEEELIERLMASGRFDSKRAVLRAALALLEEGESHDDYLRGEVKKGLENVNRGEFKTYDDAGLAALTDDIKARGRKTLGRFGNDPS
ncbi:type II toxin-antitoxin system ParD family antitoxin [bacterium AH-315-B06]|nr:type II toxin-antitoxin system ParD family antitoxin [bacterium AH-315-B06]